MSLIGPRPTLRYQVEHVHGAPAAAARRPARASPAGRRSTAARRCPWAERIELDVWYVEHRSPRVDLRILLRTPLALFGGTYRGATGGWRAEE